MSKNDGGPAFPTECQNDSGDRWHHEGMTLRQWYAGMALQGFLACSKIHEIHNDEMDRAFKATANYCLKMADAMIAAEVA